MCTHMFLVFVHTFYVHVMFFFIYIIGSYISLKFIYNLPNKYKQNTTKQNTKKCKTKKILKHKNIRKSLTKNIKQMEWNQTKSF